jgi:hypothetical protein
MIRRVFILNLFALGAAGCGAADAAHVSDAGAGSICGPEGTALSLRSVGQRRVAGARAPAGLAADPSGNLVAIDGASAGVTVHSPGSPGARWIPAPEVLTSITWGGSEVMAAGAGGLYRVHLDPDGVEAIARVPRGAGPIVSVAADERTIWMAAAGGGSGPAELFATRRGAPGRWRRHPLARPVRLESVGAGRVAAAAISPPHAVTVFDSTLARRGTVEPRAFAARAADGVYTQALVRLDCGRFLQVVADLRSDRRTFHLYSTTRGVSLVKSRTLRQPLGVAHSLPAHNTIVGVTDGPGWWKAEWLQWSWTTTGDDQ